MKDEAELARLAFVQACQACQACQVGRIVPRCAAFIRTDAYKNR